MKCKHTQNTQEKKKHIFVIRPSILYFIDITKPKPLNRFAQSTSLTDFIIVHHKKEKKRK